MGTTSSTTLIALKGLVGNAPTALNPLQIALLPHVHQIVSFWAALWIMTALVLLYTLFQELRSQRNSARRSHE